LAHKFASILRKVSALLALAFALGVISACGGGDDDDKKTATATAVATSTRTGGAGDTTATPADSGDQAAEDSLEVNETVYHAGYKVSLGTATLAENVVKIEAQFENLGSASNATIDSLITLQSGGNDYADTAIFDEDLPALAPKGKGTGNFAIRVDDNFSLDDAVLIIGHPDNNQAIIPLGANSSETLVTLEPKELMITGRAVAGPVSVDLEGGELRADLPDLYGIADKDHLELTLNFSVTPGNGIPIGQGVFQDQNVKLKTPDGKTIAVRDDGRSGVNELLQGKEGTTISDLEIRFEVKKPTAGQYTLIVHGLWGPSLAEVTGETTFTVPAAPTLGE
jgi:hypothetical protein